MIEYITGFAMGIVLTYFLSYIMSLGHSVIVIKEIQKSCAALFVVSEQGLLETLELKYLAMKDSKRSDQNITAQRHIDQMNVESMRNSIMRNFVGSFPNKYSHLLEYTTWEEMREYVNKTLREGDKLP